MSRWKRITDHFGYVEFFIAEKSGKIAEADIFKAFYLARMVLEPLRRAMGGKPILVTSGKRSAEYNRNRRFARNSDHLYREETAAVDISFYSRILNKAAAKWVYKYRLYCIGQLIIYVNEIDEVGWLHISLPSRKHHGEALIASVEQPRIYTEYLGGEIARPIIKER